MRSSVSDRWSGYTCVRALNAALVTFGGGRLVEGSTGCPLALYCRQYPFGYWSVIGPILTECP